jgi:hypothetical protein
VFWKNIDPITPNRQFCDIGTQYRSAIYYHNQEQRRLAEASKKALETTEIQQTHVASWRVGIDDRARADLTRPFERSHDAREWHLEPREHDMRAAKQDRGRDRPC